MNECQHTDERMNDNEKAVHDNIEGGTAKQRERGGDRKQTQNKEKTQER